MSNHTLKTLRETATAIGCSRELLRRAVEGLMSPGVPALESATVDGVIRVDPQAAFEYVQAHARRRPAKLHAPGSQSDASAAENAPTGPGPHHTLQDPEIARLLNGEDVTAIDAHDLAMRAVMAGVSTEKIKALVLVANAQQRKRDSAARAGRNLPPEDVTRMLRAHGELYVDEIEAAAPRFVADLLELLRKSLGVDPTRAHPDAGKIIQNLVHASICNGAILAVRRRVSEQIKGVQTMEFTG